MDAFLVRTALHALSVASDAPSVIDVPFRALSKGCGDELEGFVSFGRLGLWREDVLRHALGWKAAALVAVITLVAWGPWTGLRRGA